MWAADEITINELGPYRISGSTLIPLPAQPVRSPDQLQFSEKQDIIAYPQKVTSLFNENLSEVYSGSAIAAIDIWQ